MPGIIQKRKKAPDAPAAGVAGEAPTGPCESRPLALVVVFFVGWLVGSLFREHGAAGGSRNW